MPDLKTWLQLTRFPNVFTAVSNVAGAYLLTHDDLADWPTFAALAASSASLYLAGMVLNDVNDVAQDTAERPFRPIPSGRVSLATARQLGWSLLIAGVLFAVGATARLQAPTPAIVAVLLAVCICLYDGVLKQTPVAPLAMGLCRFLNVLLGLSPLATAPLQFHPMFWCIAAGVGVYTVGLTWFARGEACEESSRARLAAALLVMLGGTAIIGYFPMLRDVTLPDAAQPERAVAMGGAWLLLWALFGFFAARRALAAVASPEPAYVQAAVKQAIFSLVIFDAAICAAARPPVPYAVAILVLLVPMNLIGRWVYST
jgi:4-hydroxybenzoate polyprenyltransferase